MTDYDRYDRLRQALTATGRHTARGDRAKVGWHHQDAALSMANDWSERHDLPALELLDPDGRAEQLAARSALFQFVDAIWEAPKWRQQSPTASPDYDVVAGLRDLFAELVGNAEQAIAAAGDPSDN
jgi:hypothetical protein